MAMKILLMVMLVTALRQGAAQNCRSRPVLAEMHRLRSTTRCTKPQEALVQLQVPEGYDYVRPSAAKVKRCTGLACQVYPDKCLPDPYRTTTKTLKVFAFTADDHEPKCVEVEVEEHGDCQCRCEKTDCPRNQVYKEESCECECDPEKERECKYRKTKYRILSQWLPEKCSCHCINDNVECGTDMTWVQELCRCVNNYENPSDRDSQNYLDYLHYPN